MDYVITFAGTHAAIAAEKTLRTVAAVAILPTPRAISQGCGIAIRFGETDRAAVEAAMATLPLPTDQYKIYRFDGAAYTPL